MSTEQQPVTALQTAQPKEVADLDSFIMRACGDNAFNIEKLERLIALKERTESAQRRERFFDALANAQSRMPQMEQNGVIDYGAGKGKISYARMEDIDSIIRPIYGPLGFSVSWNSTPAFDGKMVRVVGTFSCHGHSEQLEMTGPLDTSGGKNGIQGVASTVAYLKRQVSKMFWNLVERGKDKDGAKVKDLLPIEQAQADDIMTRLQDCNADVEKFKKLFGVEKIEDLRAGQLKEVWRQLTIKEGKAR